jgi:hypothetical protein
VDDELTQQEFEVEMSKIEEEKEGLDKELEIAERTLLVEEQSDYSGKGKGKETSEFEGSLMKESQTGAGLETAEGVMEASEGGGPSQANRLKARLKRKAMDTPDEDQRVDNTEAKTSGLSVRSKPPIPMMTVPPRKQEMGAPKQAVSKGGVADDKEPEGLVSDCLIDFATPPI